MLALFLLSLLLVRHAYSASACYGNSTNATAPVYIAPFDLPTIYAASTSGQDAAAANEIRNTLALYPIAIDGKNFDILSEVFADDIIANYTITLGVLTSVPAIAKGIQAAVQFVTTQHQLGTQAIDVREGSCEAKSVSYFTATHFGQGRYENQTVIIYGQYQDHLRKTAAGKWKISARTLAYTGPFIGNTDIFGPNGV